MEALEEGGGGPVGGGEFDLGEGAIGRQGEEAAEVPEASEAGDQLDVEGAAEGVQSAEVRRGVGVLAGDGGVEGEAEGMLEIELDVVDLESGKTPDGAGQALGAGNAAAGDVEQSSICREGTMQLSSACNRICSRVWRARKVPSSVEATSRTPSGAMSSW